jgi:formylglycine-generating enzyme required for sulfatase activity
MLVGVLALALAGGVAAWWKGHWLREAAYWLIHVRSQVLTTAQERALAPSQAFKECTDCPEMVVIGAGTFTMGGSPDGTGLKREYPRHDVTFKAPFAIGKLEVKFAEWDACADMGGCSSEINASGLGRGDQPVINISWRHAQQYVTWLARMTGKNYRLPSEAEWEYAARAGSATHFSFRNEARIDDYAWYSANSDAKPRLVGIKQPNQFGLKDVHGNVAEWVEDCNNDGYDGAPSDGTAWKAGNCRGRVVRGGHWQSAARALRSANRDWLPFDEGNDHTGLRVARDLVR